MRLADIVVILAVTAIFAAGFLRGGQAFTAGKIALLPARMDIFDIEEGAARMVEFELINGTDAAITVKVTASCGCSSPPDEPMLVPARSSVKVPIRVDTRLAPGTSEVIIAAVAAAEQLSARSLMSVRPIPQVVLEDVVLTFPVGGYSASTTASFVGARIPEGLEVEAVGDGLAARIERQQERTWLVTATRHRDATWFGGGHIVVAEAGQVIGRIDVTGPNFPFGNVRRGVASTPAGDDRRSWWWYVDVPDVQRVDTDADCSCEIDSSMVGTWLRWQYPTHLVGSMLRATLVAAAGEHRLEVIAR